MLSELFVILPANFLWIHTWLEKYTAHSRADGILVSRLDNCLLVCVSVRACVCVCRFRLHVFQLECIFKMEKIKEDSISISVLRGPAAPFFILNLNMECLCRLPPVVFRCWGLFRSGTAWQPWNRSSSDAAASSSTARFLACSGWLPPSAPTRAPRGQSVAGNMFLKGNLLAWLSENVTMIKYPARNGPFRSASSQWLLSN